MNNEISAQTPIQAFFGQTQYGESRWWSWLIVFWFAIIVWFYGQLLLGIPMAIAGIIVDPESLDILLQAEAQTQAGSDANTKLALYAALLLPVIAIILYVLRDSFSGKKRSIVMRIAAVCAALSFAAIIYFARSSSNPAEMEVLNSWIAKSPFVYMFMLLSFPPLAIGLWIGQRNVHKRTILSLHTASRRFRWKRMLFTMVVFWIIAMGSSLIADAMGLSTMQYVFDPSRFWMYLPVTLIFIPMQSATEEILLRGYLNQGLGHYIKNPWIVFLITSAGFAALHIGNPEVVEGAKDGSLLLTLSGYFFFGLFACILCYIDGGLESAIGMHAANNMFAATIVGYESSALPTPTVFRVPLNNNLDSISVLIMLSFLCLILFLTRRPLVLGDPRIDTSSDATQ